MAGKTCRVSFKDTNGLGHAVEVQADSMYEAAVLALRALKRDAWTDQIGPGTRITVQIQEPAVEHFLMFAQLVRWLDGASRSPAEAVRKKHLKDLLAS